MSGFTSSDYWNNFHGHILNARNNNIGFTSSIVEIQDEDGNPTGCYRTIVSSQDAESMSFEMQCGYGCKTFTSYDMFFRPVSMDGDECGEGECFPKMTKKTSSSDCTVSQGDVTEVEGETIHTVVTSFPLDGTLECIDWEDQNPIQNPRGSSFDHVAANRSDTHDIGHDYELLARCGTGEFNTPEGGLLMVPAAGDDPAKSDYADDYRLMAMKAPVIITGWGYTPDGYPIPNKVDVPADMADGNFVTDDTRSKSKFADGHLRNPFTWVTAPLDLRYDPHKNVWTTAGSADSLSPQAMVCVEACTAGNPGFKADGLVCDGTVFTLENGSPIPNPIISFDVNSAFNKGDKITLIKKYGCYEQVCGTGGNEGGGTGGGECPEIRNTEECVVDPIGINESLTTCNIDFGKNLKVTDSTSSGTNTAVISSGVSVGTHAGNDCVCINSAGEGSEPAGECYPEILIGKGLCASDEGNDGENCRTVIVGLGVDAISTDSCIASNSGVGTSEKFCKTEFAKGLNAHVLNGELRVGIGLDIDQSADECITETDSTSQSSATPNVQCLRYGEGLGFRLDTEDGCTTGTFGVRLEVEDDDDCYDGAIDDPFCSFKLGKNLTSEVKEDKLCVSAGVEAICNGGDPETIHTIAINGNCSISPAPGCKTLTINSAGGSGCLTVGTNPDICCDDGSSLSGTFCSITLGKNMRGSLSSTQDLCLSSSIGIGCDGQDPVQIHTIIIEGDGCQIEEGDCNTATLTLSGNSDDCGDPPSEGTYIKVYEGSSCSWCEIVKCGESSTFTPPGNGLSVEE